MRLKAVFCSVSNKLGLSAQLALTLDQDLHLA